MQPRKRRKTFIAGLLGSLLLGGGTLAFIRNNAQQKKENAATTQEGQYTNRLIKEKSPYLLQHAHNPMNWYPWGEEAFEKARREDKPIFLSIGYSTCH